MTLSVWKGTPMELSRRALLIGSAALTAGALAGCARRSSTGSTGGMTLTLAPNLDNNSFDRGQLNLGNQSQYWGPVFDTLLTRDEQHNLAPNLADKWSYNDDLTELTLTLHSGVTFTDGEPFDAEAVKANWEFLAKATGQNAFMASAIKEVRITSATELVAVLKAPDPGFLEYLASVGGAMASPKSLGAADSATKPVGTGPYQLDAAATVAGSTYTFTKVAGYFSTERYPYDKIVLKPINELTARLNALKAGQVNGTIADIPSIKEAEASGLTVNVNSVNWLGLLLFDRDGTLVPEMKDVRVRQAMNYAINWKQILDNIDQGRGKHTTQIFNPTGPAYDPALDSKYDFDLDKAKELMGQAGVDGFTVTFPRSSGSFEAYLAIVEQMYAEINIKVNFTQVPANNVVPETISGKFPVGIMTLGSQSAWQDIQKAAIPRGPWNPFKCETPELNDLLKKAQLAKEAEQEPAMRAVSAYLVDNAWFAPWYRPDNIYLTDAKTSVRGDAYVVAAPTGNFSPKAG